MCVGVGCEAMPGPALNTAALVAPINLSKPVKCVRSDIASTSGETEAQSLRNLPKVARQKRDSARIPSQTISPCQPCPSGLGQHKLIILRVRWSPVPVSSDEKQDAS